MRTLLTTLTAAAMVAAAGPATAIGLRPADGDAGLEHVVESAVVLQQGGGPSLDQAVERVRRQCNGRIVSAETRVGGGRETHVIKCLTGDGKVKTYRIPGRRV